MSTGAGGAHNPRAAAARLDDKIAAVFGLAGLLAGFAVQIATWVESVAMDLMPTAMRAYSMM